MDTTQVISIVAIIVIIAIYFIINIVKKGIRTTAIDLIVEVEKRFKDNQVKFDTVVNGVLVRLPIPFNFIPASFVSKFVQEVFDEIKVALDYRPEEG